MDIKTAIRGHMMGLLLGAVSFAVLTWMICSPVWAAESIVITSVSVSFTDNYGDAEVLEPTVETLTADTELAEVLYGKDLDRWVPGQKVRTTLTLKTADKVFGEKFNRSSCKVKGAQFVSAKPEDNNTLIIKVDYQPVVILGDTAKAGWSDAQKTRARWDKVEYATGYQLNLYADDKKKNTITVNTNSADLSSYITSTDATWYYEVRAIGYSSEDKKYRKAGNYVTSEDTYFSEEEMGDVSGSWKSSTKYQQEDGTYAVNTWKHIQGKWYYFDGNGNRVTGWLPKDGKWYYLKQDGAMETGWIQLDGKSYYLNADNGDMAVGWAEIAPGVWYFFHMDGSMAVSTWIGSYWVDANGIWTQTQ